MADEKIYSNIGHATAYAYAKSKGYTGTEEQFATDQANFAANAQQVREDKESVEATVATFGNTTVPAAVQTVTAEGTRQVGIVGTAGDTQVARIQGEGTTQVGVVQTEGTTQKNAVQAKGDEVIASIPSDYTELTEDVEDLKSAIKNETVGISYTLSFSQGAIGSATGKNTSSTTRIRTDDYIYCPFGFSFTIPAGYKGYLFFYTGAADTSFISSDGWLNSGDIDIFPARGNYVRFVIAKSDDTTFSPSDLSMPISITCYAATDLTLSNKRVAIPSGADLDDYTTEGNFVVSSAGVAENIANMPTNAAGILIVLKIFTGSTLSLKQIFIRHAANLLFIRSYANGAWGDWYQQLTSYVAPGAEGNISTGADLNTIVRNAIFQISSDRMATLVNAPNVNAAAMFISMEPSPSFSQTVRQFLICNNGKTFFRSNTSSGFLPWHELLNEENKTKQAVDFIANGKASNFLILSNGKWDTKSVNAQGYIVPIPSGVKKVSMTAKKSDYIAFLHSDDTAAVAGETVDFAKQYIGRILFGDSGIVEYRIHSDDAKYLYILQKNNAGTDLSPTDIYFYYDYVPEMLQELPVLYLNGDVSEMTKSNAVTLDYSLFGTADTCSCKWQGSSSQRYVKKNYTITFGTAFDGWNKWATFVNALRSANGNISTIPTTSRWGSQTKYCFKANWVDPSAARNIVCARLWGQIVKNRVDSGDVTDGRENAPNYGAIDGFPVEIRLNGESVGLYTLNIPKSDWMFAMGSGAAEYVVSGEDNSSNACKWKATALVDGTDYSVEYAPDGVDVSTIAASLNTAISAAISAGADWETTLAPYLDVDSVFDYFIFTCCVNNHDALARNILYGTYDGTKWFMSAYDLDTTFGVDPYGTSWFDVVNDRNQFAEAASIHQLAYLMYTYSSAKLKARYQALRAGILSEANVWKELSNYLVDIPTRDYDIDRNIWPSAPGTSTANMAQYMEYYRMHCKYLDDEIGAL